MPLALPALVATLQVLSAQAPAAETAAVSRRVPVPAPRSSLAAVLAQAGSLGLTAEQVRDLERRDAELQREQAAIRERFEAPAQDSAGRSPLGFTGPGGGGGPGGGQGAPGGMAGGPGGMPGGAGGRGKPPPVARARPEDPKERTARMVKALDDADTHAWLEVASRLPPALEERATAVAARYREELVAEREGGPGAAPPR